jgi:hypothetical protein
MKAEDPLAEMLEQLYSEWKVRYGSVIKGRWLYDGDTCPGCQRKIDTVEIKGAETLSLNAFFYRPRGVLIGYMLCRRCAKEIFRPENKDSYTLISLHGKIEEHLEAAYKQYLASMVA